MSDEKEIDITQLFRNVFSTYEGRLVLSYILFETGLFRSDGSSIDLKNFGAKLIEIIGYDRVDVATVSKLVEGLKAQGGNNENMQ